MKLILRNDDPNVGSNLQDYIRFCNICDKWKVPIIQAVTPVGLNEFIDSKMTNEEILEGAGDQLIPDNKELHSYMLSRNDEYAVHGLFHTHYPTLDEIEEGKQLLTSWGLTPQYVVFPFNELSTDQDTFAGLKVLGKSQRLEDYIPGMPMWKQIPTDEIVYLHHWRFGSWYSWGQLDKCLEYLTYVHN